MTGKMTYGILASLLTVLPVAPAHAQVVDTASVRVIQVDGHAVRLYARGLGTREATQPIVVFEGGSSGPIESWAGVLDALGDGIAAVTYDPPGLGGSEWDELEPTPERIAKRLRRVLAAAGVEPPYVLVGHSWEAWAVRAFEGEFTPEVAGMVLIDPTGPFSGPTFGSALEDIGAGPEALSELAGFLNEMMAGAPLPMRRRQAVIDQYQETGTDPDVPVAPSVPSVVLSAGRFDPFEMPPGVTLSFDMGEFLAAFRTRGPDGHWATFWRDWVASAPRGMLIYAADLPHCIHCADPGLVAWAIRRILASSASTGGEP
jgi:pimeloyl-ACP methyl ester carboxylesterase